MKKFFLFRPLQDDLQGALFRFFGGELLLFESFLGHNAYRRGIPRFRARSSFLHRQKGTKNRLKNLRFLRNSLPLYYDCQGESRRKVNGLTLLSFSRVTRSPSVQ